MEGIVQNTEFGCGPACVAMLCGISLEEAFDAFEQRDWDVHGATENELSAAFSSFGFILGQASDIPDERGALFNRRENLLLWGPILNRHKAVNWKERSQRAEFRFDTPKVRSFHFNKESVDIAIETFDHWAVWDGSARALRDPYGYQCMFVPVYAHLILQP
ncbi:MAG: hypothetical protein AABZ73_04370 [Pseudomonadota bacterium]|uniref:hypothetical protein n=1 Tax=Sphingobium sp. TaxID=1912891 RepID=UPI002E21573B